MNKWLLIVAVPLLLAGCQWGDASSEIDQSSLCVATSDEQAMECPEGQLFMARLSQPDSNIRAYNTLNTAALYCNTNHPIFENAAGVICVMTHERIDELTGLKNAPSTSRSGSGQSSDAN